MLTLNGYVAMKQMWCSLGLDNDLAAVSLEPEALTKAILGIGYALLKQSNYADAFALTASAREAGLTDPWLADCEARALLFQESFAEAIAIWQSLLGSGDERLESNSQKMLSYTLQHQRKAEEQRIEADLTVARGDMAALLGLWMQWPESKRVGEAVHRLIRIRLSLDNPSWRFLDPTIQNQMIALEAEVAWLASLDRVVP